MWIDRCSINTESRAALGDPERFVPWESQHRWAVGVMGEGGMLVAPRSDSK